MRGALAAVGRFFITMRPEECISLLFFAPIALALAGLAQSPPLPPVSPAAANYPDSMARLVTLVGSVIVFLWVARTKPHWGLNRDSLPYL